MENEQMLMEKHALYFNRYLEHIYPLISMFYEAKNIVPLYDSNEQLPENCSICFEETSNKQCLAKCTLCNVIVGHYACAFRWLKNAESCKLCEK